MTQTAMCPAPGEITQLLSAFRGGDKAAASRLMEHVYEELRRLAGAYMRRERAGHTLDPTCLVHEAYARLVAADSPDWQNRAHFMGFAALVMRRVLVEHARTRASVKRGGSLQRVELVDHLSSADADATELLDLDAALKRLAAMDERLSRTVELRYFGGLSVEEASEILGVSCKTVKRDWSIAKAWLRGELGKGGYGIREPLEQT